MDSTLIHPKNPSHLEPFLGDKSLPSRHHNGPYDVADPSGHGLPAEEQYVLPATSVASGDTQRHAKRIGVALADLEVRKFPMSGHCVTNMRMPDILHDDASGIREGYSLLGDSGESRDNDIDIKPFESTTPKIKPISIKKRGRPRKPRSNAAATEALKEDKATKSGRQMIPKSETDVSGSDNMKSRRTREKNRVAADRCRLRRRQEEEKLKSRHEDLEQEHRRLLYAHSELMSETQWDATILRNTAIPKAQEIFIPSGSTSGHPDA
ncbi:hypothetical protein PCL_12664, partial [Purpureocillium lilacinum]